MTRLPRVGGREMVRGSHYYLRKPDAASLVVIPVHGNRDLPTGTLRSILHQAGLMAEELVQLLRG